MIRLRNVDPLGHVDLPLIGRSGDACPADEECGEHGSGCLCPGEEFEVTEKQFELLKVGIGTRFEVVEKPAAKKAAAK